MGDLFPREMGPLFNSIGRNHIAGLLRLIFLLPPAQQGQTFDFACCHGAKRNEEEKGRKGLQGEQVPSAAGALANCRRFVLQYT